jgi:hypothetical protein
VPKGDKMKRIYIAGKLNANAAGYIINCHTMIKKANEIRKLGFSVYIPCLDFLSGIVQGDYNYLDYANNNLPWLECADAVFVMPDSEKSTGTQLEIRIAYERDIPVFYEISELVKWENENEKRRRSLQKETK